MKAHTLDAAARMLAARTSRRDGLRLLVGLAAAALIPAGRARPAAASKDCNGVGDDCGGLCTDLGRDALNCGMCGSRCLSGEVCESGRCTSTGFDAGCLGGTTDCGGYCASLESDRENCGACGHACPFELTCPLGECVCPGGGQPCDGSCSHPFDDDRNCGGCGVACPAGQTCRKRFCQENATSRVTPAGSIDAPTGDQSPPGSADPNRAAAVVSLGSSPPWAIDTVGESCWTSSDFLPALPESLPGFGPAGTPRHLESGGLVPFAVAAYGVRYEDAGHASQPFAHAFAQVASIPEAMSTAAAIDALAALNSSIPKFMMIGRSADRPQALPFIVCQEWMNSDIGLGFLIHWGHHSGHTIFTASAITLADLGVLVTDTVLAMRSQRTACLG